MKSGARATGKGNDGGFGLKGGRAIVEDRDSDIVTRDLGMPFSMDRGYPFVGH